MSVLDKVLDRIDQDLDRSLDRLFSLLRIRSISTDPAYTEDCKLAAEHVAKDLATIGFEVSVRPTGGRPDTDVEAESTEILREMLGRLAALVPIGRIGRDRADAQQAEQPIQAAVEVLVDPIEDLVEHTHRFLRVRTGWIAEVGFARRGAVRVITADRGAFQACFPHSSQRFPD